MTARIPRYSRARVITILFALVTAAALQLSLAAPALGATTRIARCDGANLRAHPTTSAKNKIRMNAGAKVTVSGTVSGGHWHTYCGKGSHTGNTWFKITSINGKSVKKRFGVPYLYGATWLYRKRAVATAPKPVPTSACTRRVSADKTGGSDVTAELQRFIDASPGGSVICLASGGQYKVNGTLHIADRSHLTIEGQGATIFQTSRSTTRIWLIDGNSNDVNLRHMTIKGANPSPGTWSATYEHNHGVEIGGGVNIDLGAVRIVNVGGDGLYIGAGQANGTTRWADTIDLHDSTIDGTGRSGVSITDGGSNVHIDRNTFRHIAFYTLNIEPNGHVYNGQPGRGEERALQPQHAGCAALRHRHRRPAHRARVRGYRVVRRRPRRQHHDQQQHHRRQAVRRRRLQQRRLAPQHRGVWQLERYERRWADHELLRRRDADRHR